MTSEDALIWATDRRELRALADHVGAQVTQEATTAHPGASVGVFGAAATDDQLGRFSLRDQKISRGNRALEEDPFKREPGPAAEVKDNVLRRPISKQA